MALAFNGKGGGGGGSTPNWHVEVIPFSFDMPGISDITGPGVATGWTPNVGDYYIAQLCSVKTGFNGTNPVGFIGKQGFADGGFNTWANVFSPIGGIDTADFPTGPPSGWLLTNFSASFGAESGVCADAVEQYIYVLNSDDGSDPGNSAGEGILYLLVITA